LQSQDICSSLACLALTYELTVGDDVDNRAGSEGSYYDALNTWHMYAEYCICNPNSEQKPLDGLCKTLLDKLIKRIKSYLELWGAMKNAAKISPAAFKDFIENVLAPVYKQYCSPGPHPSSLNYVHTASKIFREAWDRFNKRKNENKKLYESFGETTFFKLLHMAFPNLPPFDSRVCTYYRRDKDGQCSGIASAYLRHLETVHELYQLCGCSAKLQPLLAYKTFAKILDQASWLAHRDTLSGKVQAQMLLRNLEAQGFCPSNAARILCNYLASKGSGEPPPPCFQTN
jgi:hypothetical protein